MSSRRPRLCILPELTESLALEPERGEETEMKPLDTWVGYWIAFYIVVR
jgi:hypothetical protein